MHNFVVIGWAYFKPELSKFWPNFEFDSNNVSRRGHGKTIVEIRTRISNHIFTKIRNICKICNYLSRPQYKTMFPKSPCVNIEYTTVCHYTHRVLLLYILVSMAYFAIWSLPRLKIYARISRRETHFDVYSYVFAPMICARIDYDEPTLIVWRLRLTVICSTRSVAHRGWPIHSACNLMSDFAGPPDF